MFCPATLQSGNFVVESEGTPKLQNRLQPVSPRQGKRLYLYDSIGRGGQIRTGDPLRPRQVRYRAALRPDRVRIL
jgi:hypothetical protein